MAESKNALYCSFCGKSQHEVKKLVAGPTVYICDECIELCGDIVREEEKMSVSNRFIDISPSDLEQVFDRYPLSLAELLSALNIEVKDGPEVQKPAMFFLGEFIRTLIAMAFERAEPELLQEHRERLERRLVVLRQEEDENKKKIEAVATALAKLKSANKV